MADNTNCVSSVSILDECDCVEIVERALNISKSDFELIGFNLEAVSKDTLGFCGDYFNLIIHFKKKKTLHNEKLDFFVKTLPQGNSERRNLIAESGAFEKEKLMYLELFNEMNKYNKFQKWHGICYYALDHLLVFEDLKKSGFRHKPAKETFSRDHLEVTLKCAARMHVNSITLENATGINIGEKYNNYLKKQNLNKSDDFFTASWEVLKDFIDIHPKYQSGKTKTDISNKLEKLLEFLVKFTIKSEKFRNVFSHGDLWDKNILFKYSNENPPKPVECILMDFADCQYYPPSLDVLELIHFYTTKETRDSSLEEILQFYYKCLREEGYKMNVDVDKEIPWIEFLESCETVRPMLLFLIAVDLPWLMVPDPVHQLMRNDPEKYIECLSIASVKKELLFGIMEKDSMYKETMFEVIEDLVDFVLVNF